jgi:phage gp29-like protein
MTRKLVFRAWQEEGEKPTPTADEKKSLVSAAMRRMRARTGVDENDLEDTLRDILDGWFRGVTCAEIDWHSISAGKLGEILAPRATYWAHPSHFAWSDQGWLGLRSGAAVEPLPPHKFIVGIHKPKSGCAMGASLLRPLAWWWCAANFASDWLLNLAQIFGLPFRWANYDPNAPQATVDAICNMLQNMGSAGWAAFPAGTTLELKDTSSSGDHSPQGELLDRADRYARMLILGQTMSGSQDSSKGGGKAFGSVEEGVKDARMDAAARYACKVINQQLIPAIVELNYGDTEECPEVELICDIQAGTEEARRDEILAGFMPIPLPWLREKYNIPAPAADEETTGKHGASAAPAMGKEKDPADPEDQADSADLGEDDLAEKLSALSGISDDAIFAKQLQQLADSLK